MTESEVLTEVVDGVMTITLNRPRVRNAINRATALALADAAAELDDRDDIAVAILTGSGGNFCTGMDLKAFLSGDQMVLPGRGFAGFCTTPPRKPVIAAIEGWALAGGLEIALACDLIVASTGARFGLPEVKRGLMAAAGGLLRLPRRLPTGVAMQMALTGEPITAEEARDHGLVACTVDDGQALLRARQLASQVAANAPLAVAASKRAVYSSLDSTLAEAFSAQESDAQKLAQSADAAEGARAFVDKRAPQWSGS